MADFFGGKRVPVTGRQRGDVPDVEHEWLAIEVKSRNDVPFWLSEAMNQAEAAAVGTKKLPVALIHRPHVTIPDSIVLLRASDFKEWFVK